MKLACIFAQCIEHYLEVIGNPGLEIAGLFRYRMHKAKVLGMQSLAFEISNMLRQHWANVGWNTLSPSVQRIAQQRMVNMGQMHTNLVGSAGFQLHLDQTVVGKFMRYLEMRERRFALSLDRHFFAIYRVPRDARFNSSACSNNTGSSTADASKPFHCWL